MRASCMSVIFGGPFGTASPGKSAEKRVALPQLQAGIHVGGEAISLPESIERPARFCSALGSSRFSSNGGIRSHDLSLHCFGGRRSTPGPLAHKKLERLYG